MKTGKGVCVCVCLKMTGDEETPNVQQINNHAAVMFMRGDKGPKNETCQSWTIDQMVKFGQPSPSLTHSELWVGEMCSSDLGDLGDSNSEAPQSKWDNHFATYLGVKDGANWTALMDGSEHYYSKHLWSAIPIFDSLTVDKGTANPVAQRLRDACNKNAKTAYPPTYRLWNYPCSVWPTRAFSKLIKDKPKNPAHCGALVSRILNDTFNESEKLMHSSNWYGPSTLYIELSTPQRMKESLKAALEIKKSINSLSSNDGDYLNRMSEEEANGMTIEGAREHLLLFAIKVLEAGTATPVDQNDFQKAQTDYAKCLVRYTWRVRKGLHRGVAGNQTIERDSVKRFRQSQQST